VQQPLPLQPESFFELVGPLPVSSQIGPSDNNICFGLFTILF
jgi:hypothetical protein